MIPEASLLSPVDEVGSRDGVQVPPLADTEQWRLVMVQAEAAAAAGGVR